MRNGKRGSSNGKEKEDRRIEPSRMEKEGEFEGQANCCGKRKTETVNRWSNDSVYLLPLCRRKKRDGEERERKKRARRSEARKTIPMHVYYCIIGGKERRRARREMTRQRVEGRLEHLLAQYEAKRTGRMKNGGCIYPCERERWKESECNSLVQLRKKKLQQSPILMSFGYLIK